MPGGRPQNTTRGATKVNTTPAHTVDGDKQGEENPSQMIPERWFRAVWARMNQCLAWIEQEPFDMDYYKNLVYTLHGWANPVGALRGVTETDCRAFVRRKLKRMGRLVEQVERSTDWRQV